MVELFITLFIIFQVSCKYLIILSQLKKNKKETKQKRMRKSISMNSIFFFLSLWSVILSVLCTSSYAYVHTQHMKAHFLVFQNSHLCLILSC